MTINRAIPKEVIRHCEQFKFCKGCPLGTCVAPVSPHNYDEWLKERIETIKTHINPGPINEI